MKKTLLSIAMFAMSLMAVAQVPTLKAKSVLDVDQNDKETIEDIRTTVNKVAEKSYASDDQVNVETEKLNIVLDAIYTRLLYIEAKLGMVSINHEYVDLELPTGTLWATCNLGAEKAEDTGYYIAWGEKAEQTGKKYDWPAYSLCNGSQKSLTKYCLSSSYWGGEDEMDQIALLDPTDDAATATWGTAWRIPTATQMAELVNPKNTTSKWEKQNGVWGRLITSNTNGKSIFLPASDFYVDGALYSNAGEPAGVYWTRTLSPATSSCAEYLYFNETAAPSVAESGGSRCCGFTIRPVRSGLE